MLAFSLLAVFFFMETGALTLFDRRGVSNEEIVVPTLVSAFNSNWRRHKRSIAVVPDHVVIRVKLNDEDVDIRARRSEDNTVNTMEYVMNHQGITPLEEDFPHDNTELYTNTTTQTVLIAQHPGTNDTDIRVTGQFQHGGKLYHIQPVTSSFHDTDLSHAVWEHSDASLADSDAEQCNTKPTNRYKRSTLVAENTVELFVVVDYTDFVKYKNLFRRSEADTKKLIKLNIAYATESANVRLENLREQFEDAVVRLCTVGVLIITDPNYCGFIEKNVVNGTLDAQNAVKAFVRFVSNNSWHLPDADHFIAMTPFPFTDNENLYVQEARIGSMCASDSVSLVRDSLNGVNGQSFAHGIGHSLNALNDDDYDDTSCLARFTMFPTQLPDNSFQNGINKYLFSSCSAASIQAYLPRLACTKRVDVAGFKLDTGNITRPEFYDPGQICFNEFGRASDFCRIIYARGFFEGCFGAMCTVGVYCQIPFTSLCRNFPGYEKLSCGNKKWCIKNQCVKDRLAPATAGDDITAFNNRNFPCDPRFCSVYSSSYNTNCPLTCRGIFTCPNS